MPTHSSSILKLKFSARDSNVSRETAGRTIGSFRVGSSSLSLGTQKVRGFFPGVAFLFSMQVPLEVERRSPNSHLVGSAADAARIAPKETLRNRALSLGRCGR